MVPPALKILLAEDNQENCLLIQYYLKTTPHHLDIADNGKVAVSKAKATDYDLILMDIQMPIMDGYEATKEIRVWEKLHSKIPVPIVAQTALTRKEDVSKMLANGFNHHLPKPIEQTSLLDLLKKYSSPF
jgi:CheY-like chemotaxis protein